ncbi:MAG: sigma-70 family RNA polymerase sigma factor [Deltaproteobacteria bacterium]|nr:sigma-70 family RNA polymerase sigma factor [Deltaproteobacteria bacterium]
MSKRADELFRRFGPLVLARCRRLLGDDAAAEDALQEVFVRGLRHLEGLSRSDPEALAWLYRVGTNVCLDMLRSRRFRGATSLPGSSASRPSSGAEADPARGPARVVEDREACLCALASVPAELAAPAVLYHLDELEQGKVAAILGVTRRTVINRLAEFARRARITLGGEGE